MGSRYYFDRIGSTKGDPLMVVLQATFATGSALVDAFASDPGLGIRRDVAGDYDVTGLPKGKSIQCVSAFIDLASDTPSTSAVRYVQPRGFNAATGAGKLLTLTRTGQADPPDGSRLYATFLVTENGDAALTSPLQIEGLQAWFADDVTGAGTAGFQVTDLSGNGNHGTQAVTGNQPTASGGVLNFAAASAQHYDVASAPLLLSGATRYAVVWRAAVSEDLPTVRRNVLSNQALNVWNMYYNTGSGELALGNGGDANNRILINNATRDISVEHSVTFVFDRGAALCRYNGEQIASASFDPSLAAFADAVVVGGPSSTFDGVMRHLFLIVGRIPTEAELRFLETYVE